LVALVLAPRGRDATLAQSLLNQAGIESNVCQDLPALITAIHDDVGFALLTEDAIRNADLRPLVARIAAQPAWSDLPFVLVTDHGGGPERNPIAARWLEALGNVYFLERPFHPTTLSSLVRATMKGRRRQHETRVLLESLREGELRLHQMNDQLERRVQERTAQLQRAHDELLASIAERERVQEQVRHLQKLESIGELTGGVAHDFNNLLTAVMGNLELLRKRVPPNPSTDRLIDGALQGAQRGASLTQRLLAFARRQSLELRPVDIAELVRGMDELLHRSIGHSVQMTIDLPPGIPAAQADANQIELALLNLAINARDAMPDGGMLTIALGCASTGEAQDLDAGRYVRLVVSDTGVGMTDNTLRRAIDLLITDYAMPGMTGLELAEEARRLRPGLPILLATGYADLPTQTDLELPRLSKPYQQRQLAEQIASLLG
jgi:signal transduction histidine kinase